MAESMSSSEVVAMAETMNSTRGAEATPAATRTESGSRMTTSLFLAQSLSLLLSSALILLRSAYFSALLFLHSAAMSLRLLLFRQRDTCPLHPDSTEGSVVHARDDTSLDTSIHSPLVKGNLYDTALLNRNLYSLHLYEGSVVHARGRPVAHRFSYPVRMALVNLDDPPVWFVASSGTGHMSAEEARTVAGTTGPVFLLTNPVSIGYEQNPISVYYCYDNFTPQAQENKEASQALPPPEHLKLCIAEVTNTPWGDRVVFTFSPGDDSLAKPLHVSPFMDMQPKWRITAPPPGQSLQITFRLHHPEMGALFMANLTMRNCTNKVLGLYNGHLSSSDHTASGSKGKETCSCSQTKQAASALAAQRFLWLMPHRVAFWIYWQAIQLWWKGCPLFMHPKYTAGEDYREQMIKHGNKSGPVSVCSFFNSKSQNVSKLLEAQEKVCRNGGGCAEGETRRVCFWVDATKWPWGGCSAM